MHDGTSNGRSVESGPRWRGGARSLAGAVTMLVLAAAGGAAAAAGPSGPPEWGDGCSPTVDLTRNGSFERGVNPPSATGAPRTLLASAGSPNLDIIAWRVLPPPGIASSSIDWVAARARPPGTSWQAANGVNSLDLNGSTGPGSIQQTVGALRPGRVYVVTFALAGNPDGWPPARKTVQATIAGQSFAFAFDASRSTRADMRWRTEAFAFVYRGGSKVLSFTSTNPGPGGATLDHVRMFCIP